jgi:excisionase family DNA binding protein
MTLTEVNPANSGPRHMALTIREFCDAYHVSLPTYYRQIRTGRLRAVKIGKRVLIPTANAEAWFAALPAA